jgi:hypothetical protein
MAELNNIMANLCNDIQSLSEYLRIVLLVVLFGQPVASLLALMPS